MTVEDKGKEENKTRKHNIAGTFFHMGGGGDA